MAVRVKDRIEGNIRQSDKWTTSRIITIGNTGKAVNGTDNVSWSLNEIAGNNFYTFAKSNVAGTMNDAAGYYNAMGMINISAPSDGTATYVNPNGQTGWHHFINISYQDGGAGSNSWITQIANRVGTTDLWVRSRSGGTISNTVAWVAPWTRILTGSNYTSVLDSRYVNVSGDTMTGALNFKNGTWNKVGDDVQFGDCNQAGCFGIKGLNGATGLYFSPKSGSTAQKISVDGAGTMSITGKVHLDANAEHTYNNGYQYYYGFGGSQDKNWKKVFAAIHSSVTPTSATYVGCTVKGTIYFFHGNYNQGEVDEYPFQMNMIFYSNTTVSNNCTLRVAAGCPDTIIRAVRVTTNSFELQIRQPQDWTKMAIKFSYSGNATTMASFGPPVDSSNATVIPFSRLATSKYISDNNNGTPITFSYSQAGLPSTTWLAAWNGYELRAISPNNITAGSANKLNILSGAWATENKGGMTIKFYEGNFSSYNLPDNCCTWTSSPGNNRGFSLACRWTGGSGNYLWYNTLHDDSGQNKWRGWKCILTEENYTTYCARASHTHSYLPLSGGGLSGQLQIGTYQPPNTYPTSQHLVINGTSYDTSVQKAPGIGFHIPGVNYGSLKYMSDGSFRFYDANLANYVPIYGSQVWGAVWNDYAEFRKTIPNTKPGQCVIEQGDGTLQLSQDRLLPGCEIISDTFGFAIGETDECKTPVAASGRVLAYPYEDRDSYNPGDAVCSGPNGTISRMTREEIITYPERIIGTVSEIPSYDTWGTGNVAVDGRIWIRIR